MNKVFVTGLGSGNALGICETCSLNFSWLANNPSTLLWADKICLPKKSYEFHKNLTDKKQQKVISLFLNMAEQYDLIDKIDLSQMYDNTLGEKIYTETEILSSELIKQFPQSVQKGDPNVPGELLIENEGYCGAWMASIQLDMKVAEDIGANCLFSKREHNFLKYLYGLNADKCTGMAINSAYNEIFTLYLPENIAIHNYAFTNEERCQQCKKYVQCKDGYLIDTEKSIEKMLKWREYDELYRAKEEIDKIIKTKNQVVSINDVDDMVKQFKERQLKINQNINKRFPKIERWTKMTTVMATPVTIASAITGNIPLTIGSAVSTGLAQVVENLMDVYKSKNNWVGFINSMKDM